MPKAGGNALVNKHGREHMAAMGRKGGRSRMRKDPSVPSQIGKLGGAKIAERGTEYYAELGRKGGAALAAKGTKRRRMGR